MLANPFCCDSTFCSTVHSQLYFSSQWAFLFHGTRYVFILSHILWYYFTCFHFISQTKTQTKKVLLSLILKYTYFPLYIYKNWWLIYRELWHFPRLNYFGGTEILVTGPSSRQNAVPLLWDEESPAGSLSAPRNAFKRRKNDQLYARWVHGTVVPIIFRVKFAFRAVSLTVSYSYITVTRYSLTGVDSISFTLFQRYFNHCTTILPIQRSD